MFKLNISVLSLLFLTLISSVYAADINQADCNYAIKRLEDFNSNGLKNSNQRKTFEEKATYAYAEACQSAGLVTIFGYLQEAPETTPEIQIYCSDNARSRGEYARCAVTGKLDDASN